MERQKQVKKEKDKEIEEMLGLIESRVLDLRDLGLEEIERLCQADLTWKLVPLYDCPGKERKACVVLVCSQLVILVLPSPSTSL